jgi:hypothetical protein
MTDDHQDQHMGDVADQGIHDTAETAVAQGAGGDTADRTDTIMEDVVPGDAGGKKARTDDKGGPVDAIHSPSLQSTSATDTDTDDDESEEEDLLARFYEEYGPAVQDPSEIKTQLLKPDNRLSQKASLMEIFELSRAELDAILKGEGENGKRFVSIMNTLDKHVWEPARQAAKEAGTGASRPRGAGFKTVYQEYVAGQRFGYQTYSRPTDESRERWQDLHWYAWFIHEALETLWDRNGGPLFDKGLRQDAAAQRLWYLMRRWSADNTSRRLRSQKAATKKIAAAASASGKPKKKSVPKGKKKAQLGGEEDS